MLGRAVLKHIIILLAPIKTKMIFLSKIRAVKLYALVNHRASIREPESFVEFIGAQVEGHFK